MIAPTFRKVAAVLRVLWELLLAFDAPIIARMTATSKHRRTRRMALGEAKKRFSVACVALKRVLFINFMTGCIVEENIRT